MKLTKKYVVYLLIVGLFLMSFSNIPANVVKASNVPDVIGADIASDTDATEDEEINTYANVSYTTHVQTFGWQNDVSNGAMSGTEGKSKRLEGIKIKVDSNLEGGIEYSVHCQTYGWMDFVSDYELAGTTGEAKRLESIKIKLTGQLAEVYDVHYRVHRQTYGWTDWVENGEECGTTGEAKRLECIQIKLVRKDAEPYAKLKYTTHVQSYGWLPYVSDGQMSGRTGEAKRVEAVKIDVDTNLTGGIHYVSYCQSYGWVYNSNNEGQCNGGVSGTVGQGKRMEAIQIGLSGELGEYYDLYYRVHIQKYGWLGWATYGNIYAGSTHIAKRIEAIEIKLVKKGEEGPKSDISCIVELYNVVYEQPEATSGIQKDIVDYAKQYLGVPYVYGGNSLSKGTDCSGFTMLVYQKFGVYLPHDAALQANYGRKIEWDELKAGDLIFYGSSDDSIYHVAMYLGMNQIIHQSGPGGSCKIGAYGVYGLGGSLPYKAVRLIEY